MKKLYAVKKVKEVLPPLSPREEREIARDLILMDVSLYSKEELKDFVKAEILTLEDLSDAMSVSC